MAKAGCTKVKANDVAELEDLIKGADAIEKWVLADVEKYKE